MFDFFRSLFKPVPPSGETAKERLKLVLLSDHLSLAPDVVESLKRDLMEVISRYVEIDSAHADVTFEHREREIAMLASIPITGVRDRKAPEATVFPAPAPAPARAADAALKTDHLVFSNPSAPAEAVEPHVLAANPEPSVRSESESLVEPSETPQAPIAEPDAPGEALASAPEPAATAAVEAVAAEPELAIAPPKAKPKAKPAPSATQSPIRASNAAAPRRRRRKKYAAAAAAAAAAKRSTQQQPLGNQASAQA